ncbi:hypothetical protein ACWGPT_06810 [Pseudorhizobium sp. NPDC055634]
MPTNILSIGTTAANSADVVVDAAAPLTVALKTAAGPEMATSAQVDILIKDDAGQYFRVDALTGSKRAVVIAGSGTYRFSRKAGEACGVFSA